MTEILTRPTVHEIEKILGKTFSILDHGFIRIIDYMGNDDAIVQAARVSYGKGTKKLNEDKSLINYLMRNAHTTPFEMCEIKFHIKMPIFVARQWIRHRTANVNEYSARYSILDREFYLPLEENISLQSINNKQGRQEKKISRNVINKVLNILKSDANMCYDHYMEMLSEKDDSRLADPQELTSQDEVGISRELARINLNLSYYTQMYWKIDLHNLMHFLALRASDHAQFEIRVYAQKMLEILKLWVPHTYEAFMNYQFHGVKLSAQGKEVIQQMINGKSISQEESNMSLREWNELMQIFSKK